MSYAIKDGATTIAVKPTARQAQRLADWLTKSTLRLHHIVPTFPKVIR